MATMNVNGIRLSYAISGTGEIPLVMVHGAWESRRNWDWMVPHLAETFRIVTYDRRGHGESEKPSGQGSIREHVADLGALIEHLEVAPAWVAGQSSGANVVLRLASERPDLVRGILVHEPALFSLLKDDPKMAPMLQGYAQLQAEVVQRLESGDRAGAAELFVDGGLGRGLWKQFPPEFKQMVIDNAPTFLDDASDPDHNVFDLEWIRGFSRPALLTLGDQTSPIFPPAITKLAEVLPTAEVRKFTGAGHTVMVDKPEDWVGAITDFVQKHSARRRGAHA